ncbi:hypothetical protein [Aquimarina algiphila]|uniref:Uncharacterized protein n=1 Tax=Aquimarina algiphila TaxID=2047982 RepID=A0A554VPA9_9FLAO|nr:hypothetical protein [Aquimarina algiphila]TSE10318.1 hypothetical protein FOF46_04600 [Aquimarina algiphila]
MSALGIIDKQVLKLVDYLIESHNKTQKNLDLVNETAFGIKFYPHNRNIITHMRGKEVKGGKGKSAPHLLIFNLGKAFNIDFNFFYDETIDAKDAFLSKQKTVNTSNNDDINEVFGEIEQRLELFRSENKELKGKQAKKFCDETENELLNIKTHFNKAFSKETFTEKRKEIIEVFDRMIFLSRRKIDIITTNSNLEQDVNKLTAEKERYERGKVRLEESIQKLNTDLAECNKMAFDAQKGQTEALKELLTIKSKE